MHVLRTLFRLGLIEASLLTFAAAQAACTPLWSALGATGPDSYVAALTSLPNGDVVAGGQFQTAGAVSVGYVARWNGTSWVPMGTGMNSLVWALTTTPGGDVIAGGVFTMAGGTPAQRVARWNGTSWSPMGAGLPNTVTSLVSMPNGDVFAAAGPVYRWNGSTWQSIGTFPGGGANALAVRTNGELIAAGVGYATSLMYPPAIGRWNGTAWTVGNVGVDGSWFTSVVALPDGDLVFGGHFANIGGVAASHIVRWNGATFSPLGSGIGGSAVQALAVLPDGELVAGGTFDTAGGTSASNLARWNGVGWSDLGAGTDDAVVAMAVLPDAGLVVGGLFDHAGGVAAPHVARWQPPCAAGAVAFGSGCVGSGGPNQLAASTEPWVGTTFRAVGTGMPGLALVGSVYGFSTKATPLSSLLPGGVAGCDLLVTPDITEALLPIGGVAHSQIQIPNMPAAAGFVFHHQMVALEISGVLQFSNITSTNALTLTVGTY